LVEQSGNPGVEHVVAGHDHSRARWPVEQFDQVRIDLGMVTHGEHHPGLFGP
jgi:hypothetical protein